VGGGCGGGGEDEGEGEDEGDGDDPATVAALMSIEIEEPIYLLQYDTIKSSFILVLLYYV
jgi:hypothetical protein